MDLSPVFHLASNIYGYLFRIIAESDGDAVLHPALENHGGLKQVGNLAADNLYKWNTVA